MHLTVYHACAGCAMQIVMQTLTTQTSWQHVNNTLTVCMLICLCIGSCHCQTTIGSVKPDLLSPPTGSNQGLLSGCNETDILRSLGWYEAYKPEGYSLRTTLPHNCSAATWQLLGCLSSLVNLTLTGSLPHWPDQWGARGSFSRLQVLKFTATKLAGSLPGSWAQPTAFPQLKVLNFSNTQLSGTLPAEWGHAGAFQHLAELHLASVDITDRPHQHCL